MILYAVVSGVSIGDLFMAGVLPGILMALGFIGVCWWNARRLNRVLRGAKPANLPVQVPNLKWL
jgi:TRAP-type C4-dicarboxylate transport system permease large subunit